MGNTHLISETCVPLSNPTQDDFATFHDHDHWPGQVLMLLRLAAAVLLVHGSKDAIQKAGGWDSGGSGGGGMITPNRSGIAGLKKKVSDFVGLLKGSSGAPAAAVFLARFAAVGTVWLLSFPATVLLLAPSVQPFRRHAVVTGGALLLQTVALSAMMVLFLGLGSPGKAFLKASTISTMGDLDASSSGNNAGSGSLSGGGGGGGGSGASSSIGAAVSSAVRRKIAVD